MPPVVEPCRRPIRCRRSLQRRPQSRRRHRSRRSGIRYLIRGAGVGGDAPVARRHDCHRGRRHGSPPNDSGTRSTASTAVHWPRHERATRASGRGACSAPGCTFVWTGCFVPAWWRWPTRVIADYRREEPTMTGPEWRLAQQALRWATQISPGDQRLRAKLLNCDAHVIRLAARSTVCVGGADDLSPSSRKVPGGRRSRWRLVRPVSRESAGSPSTVWATSTRRLRRFRRPRSAATSPDVASGLCSETATCDGRPRHWVTARTLSGDQRRRELEKARGDYKGCVDAFDPIVGFRKRGEEPGDLQGAAASGSTRSSARTP